MSEICIKSNFFNHFNGNSFRITELTSRIDGLLDDNKRIKGDHNSLKEKFRDLEIDYNATLRKVDEKGMQILS